jgi:predicted transposase/invertase (TIGR01784 family)
MRLGNTTGRDMQYDIVAKRLLEISGKQILKEFLHIEAEEAEILEELPQETVNIRSTDFPILVRKSSGEKMILLLELQTSWKEEKMLDILEYSARYQKKYKLPVHAAMLLFQKNANAVNHFKTGQIEFRFDLIKLWEMEPDALFKKSAFQLFPFIPLMKSRKETILKAERIIYESDLPLSTKTDLLTSLTILTGLKDKSIASELLKRRRDIMIESPVYDWIEAEGFEKGREEGREEGELRKALQTARNMLSRNMDVSLIVELTGLTEEQLRESGII